MDWNDGPGACIFKIALLVERFRLHVTEDHTRQDLSMPVNIRNNDVLDRC